MRRFSVHAAAIVVLLTIVAIAAPMPGESNRDFYQHSGRQLLDPGCEGGDCFRPLIPQLLERLPGPSLVKWKAYAVLANAGGAAAVGSLCLTLGLSATGALAAMWISAVGAGALYSIFDCYSSDALMYMLGPLMAVWLCRGRYGRAGAAGLVGVFAKEFAAAPLWIFAVLAALQRRWAATARLALTAAAVTLVWLATHASFMAVENYSYGSTASADLLHGGFLATWVKSVKVGGALAYLFTSFGALYLLVPAGLVVARRELRLLALAALPALVALVYVEQPERALWNFHFIVVPLAAIALEALPATLGAAFVASFGAANLRLGAQLPIRGFGRIALVVSLLIAAAAAVLTLLQRKRASGGEPVAPMNAPVRRIPVLACAATEIVVFAALVTVLLDVAGHRRDPIAFGANQWGHRGALMAGPREGLNVSIVGGTAAFEPRAPLSGTIGSQLSTALNARLRGMKADAHLATVVNLADPGAGAESYVATLRHYSYLQPDLVCIYDGYDAATATGHLGRQSIVFRLTGYLPRSPAMSLRHVALGSDVDPSPDPMLVDDPRVTSDPSCTASSAAYCAAIVDTVRFALQRGRAVIVATPPYLSVRHAAQQRSLAATLAGTFAGESRFRYVDLGRETDTRGAALRLADRVLDLLEGMRGYNTQSTP